MSKIDRNCLRVMATSAASYSLSLSAIVTESHAWASALFIGHRFTIAVTSEDAGFDAWLNALPEAELAWLGHFVASAEVIERSANAATIDLVVVED